MNAKGKTTKARKPITAEDIRVAKLILSQWGNHDGEISAKGLAALGWAVSTLKRAYMPAIVSMALARNQSRLVTEANE